MASRRCVQVKVRNEHGQLLKEWNIARFTVLDLRVEKRGKKVIINSRGWFSTERYIISSEESVEAREGHQGCGYIITVTLLVLYNMMPLIKGILIILIVLIIGLLIFFSLPFLIDALI
jgi:hypothetical protein